MKELIELAKKRDPDAFTELIRSQMQSLYKTATAILLNDEDAADAVQETILICWEKLGQLKEERYFKTWLTRILINECYKVIRSGKRVEYLEDVEERYVGETGDFVSSLEWKEAMAAVDEKYRLILILYYTDGFSGKEIANLLRLPHATVRTRLARGREQLRRYYEGDFLQECSGQ